MPREINYQGFLTDPGGTPVNAAVNLVFKLYTLASGGVELYSETQNSVPVTNGVFNVLIGSVTPIPGGVLFDQPYYLGVKVGADTEMTPRHLVAASAYALRSATTDAVGSVTAANMATAANLANAATAANTGGAIVQRDGSGNCTAGTITVAGDLNLSATNAAGTVGVINQGGSSLMHTGGGGGTNFFAGSGAGNFSITGGGNTGVGRLALADSTTGGLNTAIGAFAMKSNTRGDYNTATGYGALTINSTASRNVALGYSALGMQGFSNGGNPWNADNVAVGFEALFSNNATSTSNGRRNTALGFSALAGNSTGANNIAIGHQGVAGETNTICLDDPAVHTKTLLAGSVGIGTSFPTKAKVQINGAAGSYTIGACFSIFTFGGAFCAAGTHEGLSLHASDQIAAASYIAYSDERIKRSAGRSDAARDLSMLEAIEVTDYTYIDTASKCTGTYKKVIAQQLEKAYPQAVSRSTDVAPDIYQKAETKDGWVSLKTNLRKGERVRLIGRGKEGVHEVLEVAPGRFRTAFAAEGGMVFVYGREVNDFRSVDYEAIAMLNVSATQELNRRLEAQAMEIATLKQQMAELLAAALAGSRLAAAK